jgi:hypothetical protein
MHICYLTVNSMKEDTLDQQYKKQGCTNPGSNLPRTTKFCTVAPSICGLSVLNVLYVTLLVPGIFKWQSFVKFVHPWKSLSYFISSFVFGTKLETWTVIYSRLYSSLQDPLYLIYEVSFITRNKKTFEVLFSLVVTVLLCLRPMFRLSPMFMEFLTWNYFPAVSLSPESREYHW